MKDKFVYRYSLEDAIKDNERDLWRQSHKLNCDCARAIERAIDAHYQDNRLDECAKDLIGEYGFTRVNYVLANTVQQKPEDGRFSQDNREWAKNFWIPKEEGNWQFCVDSHPGLTDLFINQARQAYKDLGLFDNSHCTEEQNYEDHLLIIKGASLKDEYKTPENQLFYATDGNGCKPNSLGTKVFGFHVADGEKGYYRRSSIEGVIDPQYIPDWAKENLEKLLSGEELNSDPPMGMSQ